jgi:flagellar biosynthesis protein FlhB
VRKQSRNIALLRQKATIVLVLFFCFLVSGAEYFPNNTELSKESTQEQSAESDSSSENQTFLNVAVDAVVPFVTVLSQQVLYLIYENFTFEKPVANGISITLPLNFPYWEILLERIISPNAP